MFSHHHRDPQNLKEQVEYFLYKYWKIIFAVVVALGIGLVLARRM
jgi:hypothetical protein